MSDKLPDYQDRVVAFIDIIGFSQMIASISSDPHTFRRLHQALRHIKGIESFTSSEWTVQKGLQVSVFSDSIVISGEPDRFNDVWWTAGWLQANLLFVGVLLRGGISIGPTYHQDGIIYGDGMLRAYRIESSAAVYPRIVLDPSLRSRITAPAQRFFSEDSDGLTFIDCFAFEAMAPGAAELASDGYDPRAIYFEAARLFIVAGISAAKQLDHRSKWTWLAKRFNQAMALQKHPPCEEIHP